MRMSYFFVRKTVLKILKMHVFAGSSYVLLLTQLHLRLLREGRLDRKKREQTKSKAPKSSQSMQHTSSLVQHCDMG